MREGKEHTDVFEQHVDWAHVCNGHIYAGEVSFITLYLHQGPQHDYSCECDMYVFGFVPF